MKISAPKYAYNDKKEPCLSLTGNPTSHTKNNSASFELYSDPTDTNSAKYRMTILRIQGGEDTRTMLQWYRDVQKVLDGLALGTPKAEFQVVTSILSGTHQSAFETKTDKMLKDAQAVVLRNAENGARQGIHDQGLDPYWTKEIVREAIQHTLSLIHI